MLSAYGEVAQRCWRDDEIRDSVLADPRSAFGEFGWEIPEETRVELEFVDCSSDRVEMLDAEGVAAYWRRSIEAGDLRIGIAEEPPDVDFAELTERELEGVSAGTYNTPPLYPTINP